MPWSANHDECAQGTPTVSIRNHFHDKSCMRTLHRDNLNSLTKFICQLQGESSAWLFEAGVEYVPVLDVHILIPEKMTEIIQFY